MLLIRLNVPILTFFGILGYLTVTVYGCSLMTHIEIAQRASVYFDRNTGGINYNQLIRLNPDAFQAGSPYPDAYYPSICFNGVYHDVAEDTHWTPFLTAAVDYIRRQYPPPWDRLTEKLVVFLLAVTQHQVADASWHSLGIEEGFLEAMGQVNFHGSFGDAHNQGDTGGDVLNVFELDVDYIGGLTKWYVPTDDLLNIYTELYGTTDRITAEVIENCTFLLFLGRLGEGLGVIDLLYPQYASKSPFLLDALNPYFLGGVDDMAVWSGNTWHDVITMLEQGSETCDLPNNPLYIECNAVTRNSPHRKSSALMFKKDRNPGIDDDWLSRAGDLIDLDDVIVQRSSRGVFFSASQRLKDELLSFRDRFYAKLNRADLANTFYETAISYSRLGQMVYSGDVNNDGFQDAVISAPGYSSLGNYQQGRVYIVFGSASGIPNQNLTLEVDADIIFDGLQVNSRYGAAVTMVDFNADGVNDLVVSAPSVGSETFSYSGQVYVYFGPVTTATVPDVVISCTERYCNLGWSLASGDTNGDGFTDLIIGSPYAPSGGRQRGMVGVFHSTAVYQEIGQLTEVDFDARYSGLQDYEWLGYSVSVGNGQGQSWLVAGAPTFRICFNVDCQHNDNDVQSAGKTYLFRSADLTTPVSTLTGRQEFAQMGFDVSIATMGGNDVIIVSSVSAGVYSETEVNMTQAGIVEFYQLTIDGVDPTPIWTLQGDREFDRFGADVIVHGENIFVTSPLRSEDLLNDREGGRVYMYDSANLDQLPRTFSTNDTLSRFGSALAFVESPGKLQAVIGSEHSNSGSRLSGRVSIIDI